MNRRGLKGAAKFIVVNDSAVERVHCEGRSVGKEISVGINCSGGSHCEE